MDYGHPPSLISETPPSELIAEVEESSDEELSNFTVPGWSRLRSQRVTLETFEAGTKTSPAETNLKRPVTADEELPADRGQIMMKVLAELQEKQQKQYSRRCGVKGMVDERREKLRTALRLRPKVVLQRQRGRAVPEASRRGVVEVLHHLFPHRFRDEEVSVQVARPLVNSDGTFKLPRLEAMIYGRHAPLSGCCACTMLCFFDAENGVAVICTRHTCQSPALRVEPLSERRRLQLWGSFLAWTGGVLPKHRPPPAACAENAVAAPVSEDHPFDLGGMKVVALLAAEKTGRPETPLAEDFENEGIEGSEHADLSRAASDEPEVQFEDVVEMEESTPRQPATASFRMLREAKSSPPPSPCKRSQSDKSSPFLVSPASTSRPELDEDAFQRSFSHRAVRLLEALPKRPMSGQPRRPRAHWRLVPPKGGVPSVLQTRVTTRRRRPTQRCD